VPKAEQEARFAACDRALVRLVEELRPELVVGVGSFAEDRARRALAGRPVRIGSLLHPSPASPRANRGWARQALEELRANGIDLP
jgi:single-strand selective monofunctional uracil DNA glycosylase